MGRGSETPRSAGVLRTPRPACAGLVQSWRRSARSIPTRPHLLPGDMRQNDRGWARGRAVRAARVPVPPVSWPHQGFRAGRSRAECGACQDAPPCGLSPQGFTAACKDQQGPSHALRGPDTHGPSARGWGLAALRVPQLDSYLPASEVGERQMRVFHT